MGIAERYLLLDKLTGGVTVQPDYQAVVNQVAGLPGGATNAYPGRTTALATGRAAYLLGVSNAPMSQSETDSFAQGQAAMSYSRAGAALPSATQVLNQAKPTHQRGGLLGAVTGAIGDVANVVEAPFKGALNALDYAYDEGISQPLSTLITLMSDGSQWQGARNPIARMMSASNWERAYHIAEHRSPAQAAFLTFTTDDIFNQDQIAKAANTDYYRLGTGLLDGAFRWYLDPLTIAMGGMSAAGKFLTLDTEAFNASRKGARSFFMPGQLEPAAGAERVVDLFTGDRKMGRTFDQFHNQVEGIKDSAYSAFGAARETPNAAADALATAKVRDTFFKNVTRGDTAAYLITQAENADERLLVTRSLLGDGRSLASLREHNLALASKLEDFKQSTSNISSLPGWESAVRDEGLANLSPAKVAGHDAEVNALEKKLAAYQKLDTTSPETLFGGLPQAPGQSMFSKLAGDISGSRMFQTDPMQTLVRVTSVSTPRNVLDVSARGADSRFDNLLRYIGQFDDTERATLRGKFIVGGETQRWQMVADVQATALQRMADQAGLTGEELKALVAQRDTGTATAGAIRESQRLYSAKGRDLIRFKDADGVEQAVHTPLLATQTTAVADVHDWRQIRSAMSDMRRLKDRIPGVDLAGQISDKFMDIWKPSVLLSPRTGTRNVFLDEGMATVAKINSAADMLVAAQTYKTQLRNLVVNEMSRFGLNAPDAIRQAAGKAGIIDPDVLSVGELIEKGVDGAAIARSTKMKAMRAGAVGGALLGYATGGLEGALIGAGASAGLAGRMSQFDRLGLSRLSVNGFDVEASIGDRSNLSEMTRQEITGDAKSWHDWVAQHEDLHLTNMRASGNWTVVMPGMPEYDRAWERVANLQYGQDQMARRLLNGDSEEEVAQWLTTSEGKKYLSEIPRRGGVSYDIDRARTLVGHVSNEIQDLTLGNEGLKKAMLENAATAGQLRSIVGPGRVDLLPGVHAEHHAQVLGGGIFDGLKKAVDKGFGAMFAAPMEELSRIPYFDATYQADIRRRLTSLGDTRITADELRNLEQASRDVALDETKRMFYDATDRTDLHSILRNLIPFLPAQQDQIERWARITIDNPVFASRMKTAWQGLDKTVLSTTDANGDHTLQFRLPEFARRLVNHSPLFSHAFDETGGIAINKNSLNMLSGGGLGFGPIAQLVASKVVEMKPELNDSLGFIIPFGPNTNLKDVLSPGSYRRLDASSGDESSRRFMNQLRLTISAKLVDMQLGKAPKIDFGDKQAVTALVDQAKTETKHLFRLSAVAQFGLPIGVTFLSPYARQIEAYHQLQQKDPANADANFLEQFGPEYFALVARTTKNAEGIPATSAAYTQQQKLSDLISSYPEIGTLILGKEGTPEGAQFNMAVYEHQLATGQRKIVSPEEMVTDPQRKLGWLEFTRQMDNLDHELIARYGDSTHQMPNDLVMLKRLVIDDLAQKYPSWYADYADVDGTKWARKIAGMKALVSDPRTRNRPEMAPLREYLTTRDEIASELETLRQAGRPSSLTAKSNSGLSALWNLTVSSLVEKSTDFGALYHRWLEGDPLTRDPSTIQQAA